MFDIPLSPVLRTIPSSLPAQQEERCDGLVMSAFGTGVGVDPLLLRATPSLFSLLPAQARAQGQGWF